MPIDINLEQGQLFEFPTGLYEFKKEKRNRILLFEREGTGLELSVPEHKFVDLHGRGKIRLVEFRSDEDTNRLDNAEFGPDELMTDEDDPAKAKLTPHGRRALAFQFYVRKWDERGDRPLGDLGLQRLIDEWCPVVRQLGYETPDGFRVKPARLRYAIKNYGRPGCRPLRAMRSLRGKLTRRRFNEPVETLLSEAVSFYWSDRTIDYNDAYAKFRTEVEALNARLVADAKQKLPFPTKPEVLRRRINKSMCYDNWRTKYGSDEAWKKFKGNKEHLKANWPLELVVMDHTVFDTWMVLDTKHFLPLGRPGLTVAIDVATRMILGYLVSFEPPSVYTILTVLKRVNKNKRYVGRLYPHINGGWDGWGRPNEVLVDQAWENKGPSMRHALRELGTDLVIAPARTPQYKAIGERFFRTINTMLAHKLKGRRSIQSLRHA